MYLASTLRGALVETALRIDSPVSAAGVRSVTRQALAGRALSEIVVSKPITVISLMTAEDLAAALQDHWLIQADRRDYPLTREWARWLRGTGAPAQGLTWPSRRDLDAQLFLFFGDRVPCDSIGQSGPAMVLSDQASIERFGPLVEPLGIVITGE